MGKLLSVTECAQRHGVTRRTILDAITRGALDAERVGHIWAISEEACARYVPVTNPHEKGVRGARVRWGDRGCGSREGEDGQDRPSP